MRGLFTTTASLLVASCLTVNAQVNIVSDVINFRANTTADQGRTTMHYGELDIKSRTSYGLMCNNLSTTGSGSAPYGIYCTATSATANYGTGGKFDGGYVGVSGSATKTGGTTMHVGGWFYASGSTYSYAVRAEGDIVYTGTLSKLSDGKLKIGRQPMLGSLDRVLLLKPATYYYDTIQYAKMNFSPKKQFGLIAQEVETVFPEVVSDVPAMRTEGAAGAMDGATELSKAVDYVALVPVLIGAIQEQQRQINDLKTRLGVK